MTNASVNNVVMRILKVMTAVMNVGCFSHTLDRVGQQMEIPTLESFTKSWNGMFSRSPKTRLLWRDQTDSSIKSYSSTRWWSWFEVINQIHNYFGDVCFSLSSSNLPVASSRKLNEILQSAPRCQKLKIELAVTVNAMEPFVQAIYRLEGDGPLALTVYKEIKALESAIVSKHFPNVAAVARQESNGNITHEQ